MKKVVVIFSFVLIFLTGCSSNKKQFDYNQIEIGSYSLPSEYKGEKIGNELTIDYYYDKDADEYLIVIDKGSGIEGVVVFSSNRELVYKNNINLINFNEKIDYSGMSYIELLTMYGKPATDICSGIICSTYITEDGGIAVFSQTGNTLDNGGIRYVATEIRED